MEWILKSIPPGTLEFFAPLLLTKLGNAWKNKDDNTTGTDDLFGELALDFAPAVAAFSEKNQSALRKALEALYITLGNYLGKNK